MLIFSGKPRFKGKKKGILLAHTTSNDVMMRKMHSSGANSVGYAAIVF